MSNEYSTELTPQQFVIQRQKEEVSFLFNHPRLGSMIHDWGLGGLSDTEICYKVYELSGDTDGVSPEAIRVYLKQKGLDTATRKALKFSPFIKEAESTVRDVMKGEDDGLRLKAATWIIDKYDSENKEVKGGDVVVNNVFSMKSVTNISIA